MVWRLLDARRTRAVPGLYATSFPLSTQPLAPKAEISRKHWLETKVEQTTKMAAEETHSERRSME